MSQVVYRGPLQYVRIAIAYSNVGQQSDAHTLLVHTIK